MLNTLIYVALLGVIICANEGHSRTPSSYSTDMPVVNYETTLKIPKSSEESIRYVLVRGRFEYKLNKRYTREYNREYISDENKDVRERLYVNELLIENQISEIPSGYVVPRVQIQVEEDLLCFMTAYKTLLNDEINPQKINFLRDIKYYPNQRLFESEDKKSWIAPYGEMKGLDAVVCVYLGDKESIDVKIKYSFLSPEVSRFTDKYRNEILEIYSPYTSKDSIFSQTSSIKGDGSDLPANDYFRLRDLRFERVEEIYKKLIQEKFQISQEIKDSLLLTLGVFGKVKKFSITSISDVHQKELGNIRKDSLVTIIPNGKLSLKKGFFWYDANLTDSRNLKGIKKLFLGKKSNYSRDDVKPLSFYCTIDNKVVYKSEDLPNNLEFSAPQSGKLVCGVNTHKKTKKISSTVEIDLIVYDPQDIKIILESFMKDEKDFVSQFSKDISSARLESIKAWIKKSNE